MMHLVTGGSGSGKSAYAEEQILKSPEKKRIYIATMLPFGEEGRQRVERHRRMRKDKGFETVECYTGLSDLRLQEDCAVLLECVSNLTANEMYQEEGAGEDTFQAVTQGIRSLNRQAGTLVVVTNEVFSDGICYDHSTMKYMETLGKINQYLAGEADQVTEVVYGIPLSLKKGDV
ncbi:MAG TPA: bifunctional adenosylcobinamide kinase/adenosylcobinamide-phosphate guanylyltransferase [Candidatus Choladousia intestinigallinarum]|nr:bifunctional adenosylcobinamide kinase/adenosylcobinamide-phosphate guanylyltransferase [Candidatus Choladousia intestinigallinarum]